MPPTLTHMTDGYEAHCANGDYCKDKHLEQQNALYALQGRLPPLPVAPLQLACDKYLANVRALVSHSQYMITESLVHDFASPGGEGVRLHAKLLERATTCNARGTSWLAKWWNQQMYLQVRDSVITTSYFFHFADSPLPEDSTQVGRAATLVCAAMGFRHAWMDGSLPPERVGRDAAPLCSASYKYLFNSCRVPARGGDGVRLHAPRGHRHIAVACRGQFFAVQVADSLGAPLSRPQVQRQLRAVLQAAATAAAAGAAGVGVLTSQRRDEWSGARAQLLADGNAAALQQIESAAFLLCLDEQAPASRDAAARALWHGDGRNRWYDKTLQLVVFANGKAGMMNEHSLLDGTTMLALARHLLDVTMPACSANHDAPPPSQRQQGSAPAPVHLAFSLSARAVAAVARAEAAFEALVGAYDSRSLVYAALGADAIKGFGMSPDAFAQMALQLAYHRMTGRFRATYEPAQTRRFLHGRTACIRAVSAASVEWVQAMNSAAKQPAARKLELLRAAAAAHSAAAREAAAGLDADRMLLGMRLVASEEGGVGGNGGGGSGGSGGGGGELHPVFSDPSFAQSAHWAVSTSALCHEGFDNWGFAQVVPDGVGVAYMVKRRALHFNVAAARDGQRRWPARLCRLLGEALDDMRALVDAPGAQP